MITRDNFEQARIGNYLEFVPYITTMQHLYNADLLYGDWRHRTAQSLQECYDIVVYRHFLDTGKITHNPLEHLARSLHDHFILKELHHMLKRYDPQCVVGVMGGSAMLRNDSSYRQIAILSKMLTEQDKLMVSGGGSGAMEATMLGAWMAGRSDKQLDEAINILAQVPDYRDANYLEAAFQVMETFPSVGEYESLSIPTWLYGHEPTTPFATHIAKLFQNSVREDTLLTVCFGGLVFAPGSAGTMQEIFQDAVQNHYLTLGIASPMIFLGRQYWTEQMPAYSMLRSLSDRGLYHNMMLTLTDDNNEVLQAINRK